MARVGWLTMKKAWKNPSRSSARFMFSKRSIARWKLFRVGIPSCESTWALWTKGSCLFSVVDEILPTLGPQKPMKMKVLNPQYMGEMTPKKWRKRGFPWQLCGDYVINQEIRIPSFFFRGSIGSRERAQTIHSKLWNGLKTFVSSIIFHKTNTYPTFGKKKGNNIIFKNQLQKRGPKNVLLTSTGEGRVIFQKFFSQMPSSRTDPKVPSASQCDIGI